MAMDDSYRGLDDRPAVAAVTAEVALKYSVHLEPECILAARVLGEERVEVGREAFVEPEVGPILARQEVAEPLVRQLVRDQAVGVSFERGDLVPEQQRQSSKWPRCSPSRPRNSGRQVWAYLT